MFTKIAKDVCEKAAEVGNCQNYEARWYYDTKEERCRQFYYGGCGGNENRFNDEQSCLARCDRKHQTEPPPYEPTQPSQPSQPTSRDNRICFLPSEAGECRTLEARWYYNSQEGICDIFGYGGCGGNQNNFLSSEECEQHCGNVQDLCSLPSVYGRCQENITRWWYDQRTDECVEFEYSGCRGNRNNFYTESECKSSCQRRPPAVDTTSTPQIDDVNNHFVLILINYLIINFFSNFIEQRFTGDICTLRLAQGDCHASILSYFYNVDTNACEEFYYTGCGGNENRFNTREECEQQCGPSQRPGK